MLGAAADQREIIDRLRGEIAKLERRPARRAGFTGTGRPEVDRLLPGEGLPRGDLSEIAGGPASGKTVLALGVVANGLTEDGLAAFVDGQHQLYPPAVQALGIDLARLLIVRPGVRAAERGAGKELPAGLWAAEVLLSSGAFEVVVVDVPLRHEKPARAEAMLRRLRAAAEKGGAVAIWLAEPDAAHRVPAAVRLTCDPPADARPGRVRCLRARGEAPEVHGAVHSAWPGALREVG
jgi:protein ImuA